MEKVILGTGCYDNVKSGNMVSITGDGGKAWGFTGNAYRKLAPRLITYVTYAERYQELLFIKNEEDYLRFRELIENEYIRSFYQTRLKDMDINGLLHTLKEIYGNDIILLCHEDEKEPHAAPCAFPAGNGTRPQMDKPRDHHVPALRAY